MNPETRAGPPRRGQSLLLALVMPCCLAVMYQARADGTSIDKIYHPYVQALEREVELRSSLEDGSNAVSDDRQTWRLGYGQSLAENWFGELYLIAEQNSDQSMALSKYEAEALWQATEQGEYPVDAGLLFEFEKSRSTDSKELSTTLLLEREWGQWTGTANLRALYETGTAVRHELEPGIALQLRYRYAMQFEPALEYYNSQNILGLGPAMLGDVRLGEGRRLHWESGLIVGIGKQTPNRTLRLLLEYEF
jgi:hypothetical protein